MCRCTVYCVLCADLLRIVVYVGLMVAVVLATRAAHAGPAPALPGLARLHDSSGTAGLHRDNPVTMFHQ